MGGSVDIEKIINDYRVTYNIPSSVTRQEVISIMIQNGDEKLLLNTQNIGIDKKLLFGLGFNKDDSIDNLKINNRFILDENPTFLDTDVKLTLKEKKRAYEIYSRIS